PPGTTLLSYATLFRSRQGIAVVRNEHGGPCRRFYGRESRHIERGQKPTRDRRHRCEMPAAVATQPQPIACIGAGCVGLGIVEIRSEEHTSELQSRVDL